MTAPSKPARRVLVIGVIAALAGVAAWGAAYLDGSESPSPPLVFTSPGGDGAIASSLPSEGRGNEVLHGDAAALASFQTVTPPGGLTALPATGDPVKGTFSPVADWPLMGIHAVLTPDGRVLSYGTSAAGALTGHYIYDLWDPQLGLGSGAHTVLPNNSAVDIFCNAQLLLPNGNIEMWGGDVTNLSTGKSRLLGNDDSNVFNPLDNSLVRTGKMWRQRWYATATTLPNGEVYIQGGSADDGGFGGGKDLPEVRTSTGQFRLLTGADTNYLNAHYPRNFLAPDGKVFGLHYSQMYRVDPSGTGTLTRVGKFSRTNIGGSSASVLFRPGKILQLGGGLDILSASPDAHVVDINPNMPVITAIPKPAYRRHWADATVLADGRVFVSGGSTADNDASQGVAYTSEIYDPVGNKWSSGATAQRMRLYHSASLLLPDATVLTLGGGANGPQLNLNAEVYYPPYLFKADGTPASRPIISTLPMTTNASQKIRIGTPSPSGIARVTMVKTGSVTHSIDMDQRFLELPFTVVGGELEASLPSNAFLTPPGFYMVFVINTQGVPSEAAMTRINVPGAAPVPTPATLTVRKIVVNDDGGDKVASDFSFSVNGAAPVAFSSSGSNVLSVPAGTYTVTEPAVSGYAPSLSGCSGIVLAEGGSATCTITNNDDPPTAAIENLVVNGDFELNPVPSGTRQLLSNLAGWTNKAGPIPVWRNGHTPGRNESFIEIDGAAGTSNNRIYQIVSTVSGATYELSFLHSPRPGNSAASNRFDVYWNGTRIERIWIDGSGLSDTSWRRVTLVVTGTGSDRLSFFESDADTDDRGALIDDVQLTRR